MAHPGTGSNQDIAVRLGAAADTAKHVLIDPKGFYAAMPRSGGFEEPGIFAGIMLVAAAIVLALWSLLHLHATGPLAALVLTPLFGAIGLLVGTAIIFLLSQALGGRPTFESSFRIAAYASALWPVLAALSAIPYLPLLAAAYGIYLTIVAVIAVNEVPEQKAWTVLGGLGALLLVLSLSATIAARRAASDLQTWSTNVEKSADDLRRAAEQMRREIERQQK